MIFLIATNNDEFLNQATSIIEKELPQIKHIQDVIDQQDLIKKAVKQKIAFILIDLNSCSINTECIEKLSKLKGTKVKIASQNHADFPVELFNQKSIQLSSLNYKLINQELKKLILNNKDYFWGEEIKQVNLYKDEILCREGSIGDAIYLIRQGNLQRVFPDGSILDGSIGAGKMVGELAYFNREPRKWKITAVEDSSLVRIGYQKVDLQLADQPSWIKVMIRTLAERSIKYAKLC